LDLLGSSGLGLGRRFGWGLALARRLGRLGRRLNDVAEDLADDLAEADDLDLGDFLAVGMAAILAKAKDAASRNWPEHLTKPISAAAVSVIDLAGPRRLALGATFSPSPPLYGEAAKATWVVTATRMARRTNPRA
jgi:hypothetical protein